jgi:3-hydroxyacyl-[acyl-carrier-protein] dehydratase
MVKKFNYEEVKEIMPQQPPFMFIDEAEIEGDTARGTYKIRGDESFLQGHFPGNPVCPASIMLEGLGQLAILLLLGREIHKGDLVADPECVFFTSTDGVRCTRICRPGDVLQYKVKLNRLRFPLGIFEGKIFVGEETAAYAEKISLIFDKKI